MRDSLLSWLMLLIGFVMVENSAQTQDSQQSCNDHPRLLKDGKCSLLRASFVSAPAVRQWRELTLQWMKHGD